MSIFRQTFPDFVQNELRRRQDLLEGKGPLRTELVNQLTTRNAWVRMTSGVNVLNPRTQEYDNELAKQYILLGGTLNPAISIQNEEGKDISTAFTKKSGIGSSFKNNAYSNTGALGNPYLRGIRPMPGITNISTASKTAYGSLIEATVNFTCWDIQQLEDLELLYMRPGYTVLLEWGWAYSRQQPNFYDILYSGPIDFTTINRDLFEMSKESNGNYEAILGYVKNYNWRARPDGGYDCSTTLISLGEILESIKVNYSPYNINIGFNTEKPGIIKEGSYDLASGISPIYSITKANSSAIQDQYAKGILNGLFYELRLLIEQMPDIKDIISTKRDQDSANSYKYPYLDVVTPNKIKRRYSVFKKEWNFKQVSDEQQPNNIFGNNRHYITLSSLCNLLNDYVLIKNTDAESSLLAKVSTKDREYAGYTSTLKCLAHPLQISTDPTKCLIRGDLWIYKGYDPGGSFDKQLELIEKVKDEASNIQPNPRLKNFLDTKDIRNFIITIGAISNSNKIGSITEFTQALIKLRNQIEGSIVAPIQKDDNGGITYNLSSDGTRTGESWGNITNQKAVQNNDIRGLDILALLNRTPEQIYNGILLYLNPNNKIYRGDILLSSLSGFLSKIDTSYFLNPSNKDTIIQALSSELSFKSFQTTHGKALEASLAEKTVYDSFTASKEALEGLTLLNDYFVGDGYSLGEISNIYFDLDYLMSVVSSPNIESRDTQNKNTVSLINFFKVILQKAQECTGNINNLDLHIDKDGVGRVIDINFTDDDNLSTPDNKNQYPKIFQLEVHNLKSLIRNYQLESKIFPEQGTIIAISAQVGNAGRLGYNNSTLVEYNRGVQDRLIPIKTSASDILEAQSQLSNILTKNFTQILKYFNFLNNSDTNASYPPGDFNSALRDLIGFFNGLPNVNPNKFKAIIPVMFSFDMDGIGGIIIGNIFRINDNVLPSGYKNNNLGFLVKSFNHTIQNNDWITKIEAYPVVLDQEVSKEDIKQYWNSFITTAINELLSIDTNEIETTAINVNNIKAIQANSTSAVATNIVPILNTKNNIPKGAKALLEAQATFEGYYPDTRSFRNNNPGNLRYNERYNQFGATREREGNFAIFPTLEKGLEAKFDYIKRININSHKAYPKGSKTTLLEYINIYAPGSDNNNPIKYTTFIIGYFKGKGINNVGPNTTIEEIFNIV
jgi:hypothetical protein